MSACAQTLTLGAQVDGTISKMDGVEVISSDAAVSFWLALVVVARSVLCHVN